MLTMAERMCGGGGGDGEEGVGWGREERKDPMQEEQIFYKVQTQ